MIDRVARNEFAELLRHFVAGQIENFDFENRVPSSNDPAINEIWWIAAWPMYDDFRTHKLEGKWRIPEEYRREIAKAILFLKSDHEYIWPKKTGFSNTLKSILNFFTKGRSVNEQYLLDENAWPFARMEDLDLANKDQPYLNGNS